MDARIRTHRMNSSELTEWLHGWMTIDPVRTYTVQTLTDQSTGICHTLHIQLKAYAEELNLTSAKDVLS